MPEAPKRPMWYKGADTASWVTRFTVGDDPIWDIQLLPFDLAASEAHAGGLVTAGILSAQEYKQLSEAFGSLKEDYENGLLSITPEDEDCHTVIERLLVDRLGDVGKKIHTGRSRNDQVLAALRLWLRQNLDVVCELVDGLATKLADLADENTDQFLPGYTHMQRAMPSSVALWALGFAECLCDDLEIVREAQRRMNVSPLGSGAGYGIPHVNLDRDDVASNLGFERVQENVTAVQLSRGKYELGVVHALVQCAATINRLASDIVLFATSEFGFIQLDDSLTTGSSIMQQKKNPDIAELARATLHRISAEMHLLVGIPANLPSGYHRDLQLTKSSVMKSVLMACDLLHAATGLINGLSFRTEKLEEARDPELYATAAALKSVASGSPFRTAYQNASQDTGAWSEEASLKLREAYTTRGAPGRTDSSGVRSRLDQTRKR